MKTELEDDGDDCEVIAAQIAVHQKSSIVSESVIASVMAA